MKRILLQALVLTAGGFALSAGWSGQLAQAVLILAAVLPYLVIRTGTAMRAPLAVLTLAALLPLALAAGYAVFTSGSDVLRDVLPRLLTSPRPAPATAELLLPGVLLAGFAGTWAGVRASRDPARHRFAPVVCAAVLYVAGALLTAGQADPYGVLAGVVIICTAASWSTGSAGTALVPVAVTAAVAAFATLLVPAANAFEPRNYVDPPPLPLMERNPLPRLAALAEQSDVELFRYTGPQAPLRLVTLTEFDGTSWSATSDYRPVGAVAERTGLPPGPNQSTITVDVTIGRLDGLWLPSPGQPQQVSLAEARVDTETGSLALPQGLSSGLRYRLSGTVDAPGSSVTLATVPWGATYTALPRLPYIFTDYAQTVVRGASTAYEQALLIENAIRQNRRLNPRATAGSSYARLETFLFGKPDTSGGQQGTAEQFAAAFAVLARVVGLPTRVVAGFRPGEEAADGTWVVRGTQATAWAEVYFAGHGWVVFDPANSNMDNANLEDSVRRGALERVEQNRPKPEQAAPVPTIAPPSSPAPSAPAVAAGPAGFGLTGPRIGATIVIGLLAALLLSRALRRMRHRRAGARGAWSEVLDLLVLMRRRPNRWHTADLIAMDIAAAVPASRPHPAFVIAQSADRAEFAPSGSAQAQVWQEVKRLRRAARRAVPWHRRLFWSLDPRPLLRR